MTIVLTEEKLSDLSGIDLDKILRDYVANEFVGVKISNTYKATSCLYSRLVEIFPDKKIPELWFILFMHQGNKFLLSNFLVGLFYLDYKDYSDKMKAVVDYYPLWEDFNVHGYATSNVVVNKQICKDYCSNLNTSYIREFYGVTISPRSLMLNVLADFNMYCSFIKEHGNINDCVLSVGFSPKLFSCLNENKEFSPSVTRVSTLIKRCKDGTITSKVSPVLCVELANILIDKGYLTESEIHPKLYSEKLSVDFRKYANTYGLPTKKALNLLMEYAMSNDLLKELINSEN